MENLTADFWNTFLKETGRGPEVKYADCYCFADTAQWADKLLELVLKGIKKATSSSLCFFKQRGMKTPEPGDLSVLTGWDGRPRCVIETTAVTVLPFREMTYELCKREGEDDCLESWREGHIRFFTSEGKKEGYAFTWDMPVVFEDFKVVYAVS